MNHQEDLVDRLTRFYREAKLEVPASPPAWIPAQRRSRPAWQPVLASAGLAVVALSLFFVVRVARDQATQARVKVSPTVQASTHPTAAATPTPSPTPSPDASWVTRRYPVGAVSGMLLDRTAVFSVTGTKLVRIDRSSGAITSAQIPANAIGLTETTAGVWVAAGPGIAPAPSNTQWLTLLDPLTLKVKRQVHLPGQPGSDTNAGPHLVGGNQLWLGYGGALYRLNSDTGDQLSRQTLVGTAISLSLDPSGQRLYVGVGPSQTQPATVLEYDAATGTRLASANTGGAGLGGPTVAAAADGVWVMYATGMMGAVEHRSATNLSLLTVAQQPNGTNAAIRGVNSISAFVAAGVLWIVDAMPQQLDCADLTTGAIRASASVQSPVTLVADAGGAYLGDSQGVAALQPPAACR